MKGKKQPALAPFMVVVSVLVEYPLPIAATSIDEAKRIALSFVDQGWMSDYSHDNEATLDNAEPASTQMVRDYKFLDEKANEHTF
jgi:hypothetical protein